MSFFVERNSLAAALLAHKILTFALDFTMAGRVYSRENPVDQLDFRKSLVQLHALLRAFEVVGGNLEQDRTLRHLIRGFTAFTKSYIAASTNIAVLCYPQILYFAPDMRQEIEVYMYNEAERAERNRYPQTQAEMQSVANFFVWRTNTPGHEFKSWLWDEVREHSGAIQESRDSVSFLYRPAAMGDVMSPSSCVEISREEFESAARGAEGRHVEVDYMQDDGDSDVALYGGSALAGSSQQPGDGVMSP
ncbi:hypothetical protein PENSPDRAFT_723218 [Peniophora sp. CONT]|nr:hypothetical protein PENSPDRAFT_723218 [Peniophora sp. CONT]